jgi:hypothetical protein
LVAARAIVTVGDRGPDQPGSRPAEVRMPTAQQPATGLGVGGFVTGLLSVLLGGAVPVAGVLLGGLGVVLGGVGRARARAEQTPTGLATAGVVLGALGLGAAVVVWTVVVTRG